MRADLRGPHDLGEIVGYAYRLYLRNFIPFFLIALTTAPLQLLIGVIQDRIDDPQTAQSATAPLQLLSVVVSLVATGALIRAVDAAATGTPSDAMQALDAVFERFGAVIKTALLEAALAIASLFAWPFLAIYWLFKRDATIDGRRDWWLVLIPFALTLYLAVRWQFAIQAVMLEDRRNWDALDRSAFAVRTMWWRVLGILIVIGLIELGPVLMATAAELLPPLAAAAITSAVFALVLPFAVTAQTLLYYDLIARKQHADDADRLAVAESDVPREGP